MKTLYFRALVLVVVLVTILSFRNSFRELSILLDQNDNLAQVACSANSFTASPNPAGPSDQVTVSWDITSNCALPRLFLPGQDSIGLPSVSGTYNIGTITANTLVRLESSGVTLASITVSYSAPVSSGLLFHSTLDDAASVTSPAVGTGAGASLLTSPANDFTAGRVGNAIRLDSISEYVRFKQTDGNTKNVELDRGTLDFWFQPTYNHTDGQKYRIFGMGNWGAPGGWGMGKHNTSNGNALYIHKFGPSGNMEAINTVSSSNYSWNANDWINVRVTWDWKAAPGVQNVRMYFNGVEIQVDGDNGAPATTGTWYTVAESTSDYIYVGNTSSTNTSGMMNNANFDEVKIWDTVIPIGTTPPPPSPTLSITATPSSITSGSSSTLTWSSTNATSCTAGGGWSGTKSTSGTQSVSPTSNTNYTLTCTGAGGSANKSVTVTVASNTATPTPPAPVPLPPLVYPVPPGDVTAPSAVSNLRTWGVCNNMIGPTWDHATDNIGIAGYLVSRNGTLLTETIRTRPLNGSMTIRNWTTDTGLSSNTQYTYSVRAFDTSGNQGPATTITPRTTSTGCSYTTMPPVPKNLNVTTSGNSATITWSAVTDALYGVVDYLVYDYADLNNPINPVTINTPNTTYTATGLVNGSTHNYYVAARNSAGVQGDWTHHGTVTIGSSPVPTVNFSASPSTISPGGSATLTWSSTGATSCTAGGGWSGSKAISGTQSVSPTSTTVYTIDCTGTGGTTRGNVIVNISAPTGPISFPAQPQLLNFSYPQVTGKTWTVNSGGNLQTALNQAQRGDEIVLEAGATFIGNFTLPPKSGTSADGWIVIRSNQSAQLPSMGIRVSPAHAPLMPKILTSNVQPALLTSTSAVTSGWWITGIEVSVTPTYNTQYIQYGLVRLGSSGSTQNTLAKVPYDIVLDRMYIHGLSDTPTSRCVELNSARTQISDSYLAECHVKGFDSQAILGWNGPGPFKIVNNMLMGDTENLMFGGSDPSIPNLIPSDIEIRGNYIYTPASWGAGMPAKIWTKKNLFELKNSSRVLLEGNILDGSWSDAQKGMAIVIRSTNQNGNCNWCQTTDFTMRYNILRNAPGVFDFLGTSNNPVASSPTRILIEHNLFENIGVSPFDQGSKIFAQFIGNNLNNSKDVTIRNNTVSSWGNMGQYLNFGGSATTQVTNFEYKDNITFFGNYGIFASGGAQGESVFTGGTIVRGTSIYTGNVAVGTPNVSRYPTTQFVSNIAAARATGKGANESAVLSATQYAENGGGTPPPPPPPTPPPVGTPGLSLTLNPTSVQSGFSALLTWLGTNVSTCTASGGWSGARPTAGSLTVSPTVSTTYTLLCSGGAGQTATRSATLGVTAPPPTPKPVVTLIASPSNINLGQSSSLTWTSTNATSCTASGSWQGTKTTSGVEAVSPQGNATYTIDCTGNGGTTSQSVTVNVTSTGPLPTLTISANPSSVQRGSSSTLTWSSTNATSCTATGDWSGSKAISGNASVSPSSSATYTLICTNTKGSASASANITVTTPALTPPADGGGGGGEGSSPVCPQVITWAKSPLTGEVRQFSTPCDVPTGWIIINPAFAPVPLAIQPIDRPLYIGLQDPQVVRLQDFLKAKGFFPSTQESTGYFGPLTMKAVQDYQRSKGIEALGNVGPQTRAAIAAELGVVVGTPTTPTAGAFTRSLYRGSKGADVTYLQLLLKKLGYFPFAEPTTTYFGPLTENAVKAFQKANGIVSSGNPSSTGYGLAGVRTRAKIIELTQ